MRFFAPGVLCIVVLGLVALSQIALLVVEWWPWFAGLTELGAWLVLLVGISGAFVVSLVLLFIAWVRRGELANRRVLYRTTTLLLLLPLVNVFFLVWFPTSERLVQAAQRGDLAVVQRCLFWGIDPDGRYVQAVGFGGRGPSPTALVEASRLGHLDVVKTLAEAGADVDALEQSALRGAVFNEHAEVVSYLLAQDAGYAGILEQVVVFSASSGTGLQTFLALRPDAVNAAWPLLRVAHGGEPEMARLLARVDVGGRFGEVYELYRHIVLGNQPEALSLLREVEPGLPKPASVAQRLDALRYLLRLGKDDTAGADAVTAEALLFVAAKFGMVAVVDHLLADDTPVEPPPDPPLWYVRAPLSAAAQYDHPRVVASLLAAGGDVHRIHHDAGHPLYASVAWGSLAVSRLLLDAGAPVDSPGTLTNNRTPLMVAVWNDDLPRVRLLIERGADPTLRPQGNRSICVDARHKPAVRDYVATLDCDAG